jgi:hypothetical protein
MDISHGCGQFEAVGKHGYLTARKCGRLGNIGVLNRYTVRKRGYLT